ncbi:MAG: hypothetical protein H6Q74_956 [Firmicutes bacterium]|nr:hypothetical protein [Bacillota bacterium]
MKINIALLDQEAGACQSFRFACPIETIDEHNTASWIEGNVEVEGKVCNTGACLALTGEIHAKANRVCHRCLKEFSAAIVTSFSENWQQADGDSEVIRYQGDELDISELVRESLVLAEPLKNLCSEMCRGLCPTCGADLNHAKCNCVRDEIDPRLAALQKLLEK